jgi:hypothetical protein
MVSVRTGVGQCYFKSYILSYQQCLLSLLTAHSSTFASLKVAKDVNISSFNLFMSLCG